jgi:hypothetical protein
MSVTVRLKEVHIDSNSKLGTYNRLSDVRPLKSSESNKCILRNLSGASSPFELIVLHLVLNVSKRNMLLIALRVPGCYFIQCIKF